MGPTFQVTINNMSTEWTKRLIFAVCVEDPSLSNEVLKEVILYRHPSLARTHSRYSIDGMSLPHNELLTIVKDHLSRKCLMILKNLLQAANDGCTFSEMVPLLQGEFLQMSSMIEATSSLDHSLDTSLFEVRSALKEHLKALEIYVLKFQVPMKNSIDWVRSCEILTSLNLMEAEKKIERSKTALKACPDREAVKTRMARVKEMKGKMSLLSKKIQSSKQRLSSFCSLDPKLVEQLKRLNNELEEKQWAAEQLGGISFDESSIVYN